MAKRSEEACTLALWMIRAGKSGIYESVALDKGISLIGWSELPDLSSVETRQQLEELCRKTYPDASPQRLANYVGQLWMFRSRIKEGDLVVLPLKTRSAIAIGRISGPYEYRSDIRDMPHTRKTTWLRTDVSRSDVDADLLFSLGAVQTICQIQRNDAERRVEALLEGKKPLPASGLVDELEQRVDLEQYAREQIREYLALKFKGHELARLVSELLRALGYKTWVSAPGRDGGTDILAGAGQLGFEPPRLCVQVKSSDEPVDVGTVREFQAVIHNFGANEGLFVSFGGYTSSVLREFRQHFFLIRLWDAGDLVQALLANYDRLAADIQAELPLKRVWVLVQEDLES